MTSGRINRNLWNHVTIDANMQTELKFVENISESDMIRTRSSWNSWICSIRAREQSEEMNTLVSAIMDSNSEPKQIVERLNHHFFTMNIFMMFSRVCFVIDMHAVKFFIYTNFVQLYSFLYDELLKFQWFSCHFIS